MAKINIEFDGKIYSIDESTLAPLTSPLEQALINQLAGTGAVIRFNGNNYDVDADKLASSRNVLIDHLSTVAGSDSKVTVAGAEYGLSKTKLQGATDKMHGTLAGLGELLKTPSEGLEYVLSSDGQSYIVSGIGTCADTDIIIPSEHEGLGVTKIGDDAFKNCDSLTSVTIPNSVTRVEDNAFNNCTNLMSVTMGNGVTSIGDRAFYSCDHLAKVYYDGDIASWCNIFFYYDYYYDDGEAWEGPHSANPLCNGADLYIKNALGNYELLTDLVVPNTVSCINAGAFDSCTSLTSVTIPDSVTSIGYMAFCVCTNLISVTIGNGVERINSAAFYNCYRLANLTISDSVTSIGTQAFYACHGLTSITIPDSVTSIGSHAFEDCSSLTSVTIGSSVTNIEKTAFYQESYGSKLVEVINHSSLPITVGSKDHGYVAYYALEVHDGESKIKTQGDYQFYTVGGVNYLFNYTGNDTELTLPSNYNGEDYVINDYVFYYNDKITKVTIPDSVTSIGDYAFYYCDSLMSVTIGNSVTSIGDSAFAGCDNLVEVINKSNLSLTVGSEEHGYVAYYALEVHKGNSKLAKQDDYYFYTVDGTNYLVNYIGTDTELTLPANYNGENYGIADRAFDGCRSLTSIAIPDSVTSIGASAFYACHSLTSVTIPDSVLRISDRAFSYCSSLTSVTIGNSVTSIGASAFYNCSNLTSVTIGSSVTSIGSSAFEYCDSLTSLTIPNSVTSIGGTAFEGLHDINIYIDKPKGSIPGAPWVDLSGSGTIHWSDQTQPYYVSDI